jgi:ethanolamine utilization protein EutQ (cupin superfamily)
LLQRKEKESQQRSALSQTPSNAMSDALMAQAMAQALAQPHGSGDGDGNVMDALLKEVNEVRQIESKLFSLSKFGGMTTENQTSLTMII